MKHLFVPYEIARQLKEKGFNEPCLASFWNEEIKFHSGNKLWSNTDHIKFWEQATSLIPQKEIGLAAPLYQQVIDWFREKHRIHIQNDSLSYTISGNSFKTVQSGIVYRSYYEALTKAIEAALNLIA